MASLFEVVPPLHEEIVGLFEVALHSQTRERMASLFKVALRSHRGKNGKPLRGGTGLSNARNGKSLRGGAAIPSREETWKASSRWHCAPIAGKWQAFLRWRRCYTFVRLVTS
jgi:hypothetical protein